LILATTVWAQSETGGFGAGVTPQPPAPAAPAAPAPDVMMGQGVPSVADLFMTSPVINIALLALSVIAVLIFAFLFMSLCGPGFIPARFIDEVTKLVIGRRWEQAQTLCRGKSSVFSADIIQRCVENCDKEPGVLMSIVETEGRRRADVIWNRIGYLSEIASIAPLLGLLGTVLGMIEVFFNLVTRTAGEKAAALSSGIAQAMATTMFGLIVAILASVLYVIIRGRASAILGDTEKVCHTLIDHIHRAAQEGKAARA